MWRFDFGREHEPPSAAGLTRGLTGRTVFIRLAQELRLAHGQGLRRRDSTGNPRSARKTTEMLQGTGSSLLKSIANRGSLSIPLADARLSADFSSISEQYCTVSLFKPW
jgi:hypothetical protein